MDEIQQFVREVANQSARRTFVVIKKTLVKACVTLVGELLTCDGGSL